ncbi:thioredoxin domain-containing protein [Candidatus Acetothermia bacterium]|nr:thioredoxin domain-containing protein [Candidatus Acetothermia bacterium]MBI3459537.1 thioredoxin domain-containing protein [Candidatus Acetothermia bacterium]
MSNRPEIVKLTLPVGTRDHAQGRETAAVTLVEYGDYECSHCGRAYPIVKEIQKRLGDRLRFVFRNFPLAEIHPHAQHAAEAAEAAAAQGKFWEMHDHLFEHQKALDDKSLKQYAATLNLDTTHFNRELDAHVHAPRVREDFLSGVRSGVNGTPTFFINGVRHNDAWDVEILMNAIERVKPKTGS